jgi:adenylate cyclase
MNWQDRLRANLRTLLRKISKSPALRKLGSFIGRLSEIGTEGYPPDIKRRLMILNMIAYLIAITTAVYSLQQLSLDYEKYKPIIWINVALVGLAVAVPLSHRINDVAGALVIVVAEYIALLCFTMYLGRSSGVHLQYFVVAAAGFVVLGLQRLWLIVPLIVIALVLHLTAWFRYPESSALIDAEREVINSLYIQAAITTVGLIAASVYYAFRLAENAKAETDALLRNILPDSVVERLKSRPTEAIADSFPDASILFADISGFVPLARSLGAEKTVALLNSIVTEFDTLAHRHGVEKIKTIGDAYMVASGVPQHVPDHLHRLARMALDMQSTMQRMRQTSGYNVNVRIGLASGPVMAGVIGRQKFTYDVWGDAVNLAARLEGLSTPGRILLCPRSRERLADTFQLESRGVVEIKGVGAQETWFLVGTKDHHSQASKANNSSCPAT